MCRETGGLWISPHNLRTEGALDFLVDRLSGSVFGVEPLHDLFVLASMIVVGIISGHVFNDGNKRTAMLSAWEFLFRNGVRVRLSSWEESEEIALAVAEGRAGEPEVAEWLRQHCQRPK
jgi:death-on-curing family protein